MSEISAEEKRRLLRERRQQKFSKGGATSRLNKITGQQSNSFLPAESVLDRKETSETGNTQQKKREVKEDYPAVEQNTKEMQELLSLIPESAGKSETDANPELALFQQLLKMQQQDGLPSGSASSSTPDLFSSILNENSNAASSGAKLSTTFVDENVLKYHNYKVSQLKSYMVLLKWSILAPYVYFIMDPAPTILKNSAVLTKLTEKSNFFAVFTALEVVFISVYYQLLNNLQKKNGVNAIQNAGGIFKYLTMIPEGLLPIKNIQGKISLGLQYLDVLSMYVTDICFVVVLLGLMKYYHTF